jgi:DNA replication protein DnaC
MEMDLSSLFENENKTEIKTIKIDWDIEAKKIQYIAEKMQPGYIINDNNRDVLKKLLQYFTGQEDFEGSLNKGLMLVGGVGTGKSLLFKIFKYYTMNVIKANSFQMHSGIDIIDNVNISGVDYLAKYSHNFEGRRAFPIRCYIDDIGLDNEKIKHFGTDISVIEQLLSLRYNIFERYGTLTHISTNKYPNQLKELYDIRITSRMSEMFNVIELKGNDYRK